MLFLKTLIRKYKTTHNQGFTLIEVLIITAIIVLLITTLIFSLRKQRTKAEDVRVKDDLYRLRIAFEEYYNDNNCYPPDTWFDGPEDCESTNLSPYLLNIPCNKKTDLPYELEYDASSCGWFKLYANLANAEDPEVQALCTYDESGKVGYNYGISSTNTTITINCTTTPSPSPSLPSGSPPPESPPPSGNFYYCQSIGNCTEYDENLFNCSPSYQDPLCTGSNICSTLGSCTGI